MEYGIRFYDIEWDCDEGDKPPDVKEITFDAQTLGTWLVDKLTDETEWCVSDCKWELVPDIEEVEEPLRVLVLTFDSALNRSGKVLVIADAGIEVFVHPDGGDVPDEWQHLVDVPPDDGATTHVEFSPPPTHVEVRVPHFESYPSGPTHTMAEARKFIEENRPPAQETT